MGESPPGTDKPDVCEMSLIFKYADKIGGLIQNNYYPIGGMQTNLGFALYARFPDGALLN